MAQVGEIELTDENKQFIRQKLLMLSLLAEEHEYSAGMFNDLAGWGLTTPTLPIKLNGNDPATFIDQPSTVSPSVYQSNSSTLFSAVTAPVTSTGTNNLLRNFGL